MAIVIGIQGCTLSGKSTSARYISNFLKVSGYTVEEIMFAGPVKKIVCELTGCTMEQLELEEFKSSSLPKGFIEQKYDLVDIDDNIIQKGLTEEDAIQDQSFWLGNHVPVEICKSEYPKTYRELLQYVGTEFGRDTFNSNIWINRAKSKVSNCPTDVFIFTDVRFDNEAEWIKDVGVLISLTRNKAKDSHGSERGISVEPNYIIDNSKEKNTVYLMEMLDKILADIL